MILNSTIESLLDRRSVRAFRADAISEEELSDILEAARFAPSALGQQNRHFTVIQNQELLEKIVNKTAELNRQQGKDFVPGHIPFYHAPVVVVVSAPQGWNYAHEDAACAIMNLMTAAHAYGLSSCYICSVVPALRDSAMMGQLQIPAGYIPMGSVALGYAEDTQLPQAAKRRTDDTTYL